MIQSAVTISLVSEVRGGPFVFWDGLAAGCEQAAALGFEAVEIFPSSAEAVDARELRRLLDKHNLKLAAMGTGAGWAVRKLRLTDPDPKLRRQAHDFIAGIINLAGSFNAPAIVGSLQGRWEGDVSKAQALIWLGEALEQLGPRAHEHGVPLLYEPLNRYETNLFNRVEDVLEFLKGLRTQNIKILCDLFHMNIEEADVASTLRQCGEKLGHVHFADSNRRAIGFGHLDVGPIQSTLKEMNYQGYLSAEILPIPDSNAAAAQTMKAFKQWFR
ncbi:MAG TPA: sugar phosphate isomerase/epimerase family protein [Candidatus Saccharimonadales bacterium]|nr:sugar phosphate isomerase/epimerase family protein [Candidatus Saccharimonadales bacterium]